MPSTKEVIVYDLPGSSEYDRARDIKSALDSLPEMSDADMASLCTKMNMASTLGIIKPTQAEANSLKTLSQKFIPDSPKRIDMTANVKTESIILHWLQTNQSHKQSALSKTLEFEEIEDGRTNQLQELSGILLGEDTDREAP